MQVRPSRQVLSRVRCKVEELGNRIGDSRASE